MPSDDPVRVAVEVLHPVTERFRSALTATHEQLGALLATQRAGTGARVEQTARELGAFAAGHFDFERLASLVAAPDVLPVAVCERMEQAQRTLQEVIEQVTTTPVVTVPAGGNLHGAVHASLALLGRAFGAALSVQLAKSGRLNGTDHAGLLERFPHARWNRGERLLAPPLAASVEGGDLNAGALADVLDGTQKLLLVVRGACPPAPLVRLITPGTYVAQVGTGDDLTAFATFDGPAIAAIVPEGAARFTHAPAAGQELAARLRIDFLPTQMPTRAIGAVSVRQQAEELRQLAALGALSASAAAGTMTSWAKEFDGAGAGGGSAKSDAVDLLAGWLLRQAQLDTKS